MEVRAVCSNLVAYPFRWCSGTVKTEQKYSASYVVLGFMLPRKPESDVYDPVQKQVRSDPHDMLSSVRYRFRDLDSRLQRLEKYVTSSRYMLDSEFRRLKD